MMPQDVLSIKHINSCILGNFDSPIYGANVFNFFFFKVKVVHYAHVLHIEVDVTCVMSPAFPLNYPPMHWIFWGGGDYCRK